MSFFRRRQLPDDVDTDDEINDAGVDPELRLRTVRTAASTIAESIRQEERQERRKTMRKKGSFFRKSAKRKESQESAPAASATPQIAGRRRNVYVNYTLPLDAVDHHGEPIARYARNKVRTSSEYYPSITVGKPIINLQSIQLSHSSPRTCMSSFVGE